MIEYTLDLNCWWFPADAASIRHDEHPPLIIYLHGSGQKGEGGRRLHKVTDCGLPKHRLEHRKLTDTPFPFVVVAPQCPHGRNWCDASVLAAVEALVRQIIDGGMADPHRLYLTGFSMGGIGTFCLALRDPQRFAAIASVCGRCTNISEVGRLRHTPTWVAYAEDDEIEKLTRGSKDVVERLAPFGNVVARPYHVGARDGEIAHVRTCNAAYADRNLYRWMLHHPYET
ncbi:MAG: prolyl oligopeptidase family serine peptidase [Rhodospirillales bacterium]|nr:prolyl oligopeptidase family serine peptidase [Rhodospirillales bacterium]